MTTIPEDPYLQGEFSDDENLQEVAVAGGVNSSAGFKQTLLPYEAEKVSAAEKQTQKKALCCSILAMIVSIPALIGA
jgi:hypothetical protein